MPGSADAAVQRVIHAIEIGSASIWLRRALLCAVIIGLALFYLLHEFRGLATSEAMDQAQIGRGLLHGQLWKTKVARPLAAGQLQRKGKNIPQKIWTDTFHAPLPPLVDAIALLPVRSRLVMSPNDSIFVGDRMIAIMSIFLFFASIGALFLVARRLFDQRHALLSCGLILIGDIFWQYSLSGLPQMLLLLLFNLTLYALVRAIEAHADLKLLPRWLLLSGLGFGLLALTHALTLWIFLPALLFVALYFRPRLRSVALLLAPVALLYAPWLLRNFIVCGNPFGVAYYTLFDQLGMSDAGHMRQMGIDLAGVNAAGLRNKISGNLSAQLGHIFEYLGWSVAAIFFFPTLLHQFRRKPVALTRWLIFALWIGATLGMAVYGITEEQEVAANQLHLLFVPIMSCFGLAWLLVQWNRLEIRFPFARVAFLTLIFILCGWPMLANFFLSSPKPGLRWPPYLPPYIGVLNTWMEPGEITASDMPWAIAWYADRPAMYLPETIRAFSEMSDYNALGGPINAVYLTPISGSQNTLGDIMEGEYKDWAPVILHSIDLQKFPLKVGTLLGPNNQCIFISDRDRSKAQK